MELNDGSVVVVASQAEREARMIDEIVRGGGSGGGGGGGVSEDSDPLDESASDQQPIDRAERRRLIKEELKRLSQDENKLQYPRRLW